MPQSYVEPSLSCLAPAMTSAGIHSSDFLSQVNHGLLQPRKQRSSLAAYFEACRVLQPPYVEPSRSRSPTPTPISRPIPPLQPAVRACDSKTHSGAIRQINNNKTLPRSAKRRRNDSPMDGHTDNLPELPRQVKRKRTLSIHEIPLDAAVQFIAESEPCSPCDMKMKSDTKEESQSLTNAAAVAPRKDNGLSAPNGLCVKRTRRVSRQKLRPSSLAPCNPPSNPQQYPSPQQSPVLSQDAPSLTRSSTSSTEHEATIATLQCALRTALSRVQELEAELRKRNSRQSGSEAWNG